MRIENRELLGILVKDVFGSITLNLERWDGLGNAQFSIGRTYFNDRLKRSVPLNSAAAEKLLALYRHALTEGSGCGYDAKKTSRKICETLESLVPGEDFRFLVFLFSDKDKVRSNKLEGILSVLALLLSMAENKETLELEKFRESYTQELKLEISKCLACFPTLVSEGATGTPKGLEPNQHHAGLPVVQTPVQTKRETSFPYSGQSPVNTERLIGSVVYPDANFVGREAELDQIHRVLTSPNNKLFLSGMGGIGKSELARQYIHRHRDDYRLILWISASGTLVHTLADDFLLPIRGLSRLDYPNDSEEDYFRRKCILLRELADADVLVVLDNYDTEDDAGLWDFLGGSYTGIITTRVTRREPRLQEMRIRPIQEMVELRDIFQRIYTRNLDAGEMEGLDRLISMLGGHTLSVRIVASILRTRRISPSRMADLLSQRFQEADGSVKKAGTEIHRAIREIFTIANLSGEEKFLLKNLACIPLCGINAEDLFKWCAFEDYDVLEGLIRKNLVMHLPNTDEVFLHPVITSVAQEMLAEDDKDVETLVRNFCLLAVHLKRGLLSEKERYLSFAEHMVSIPFSNAGNRVDSLIALGYMYNFFSRFPESEKQFSLASEICDSPEMRVWLFQLRAQMKNFEGKPEEGGDLARRGLHELETAEKAGTENGRVFVFLKRRLYGHLAESYRFRGDFEKDALYCEKALEVMDAYFGGVGLDKTDADSFPQQKTYAIGHKIGNRIGFMDGNIVLRESSVMKRFLESIPEQEYGWSYYHMGESAFVRRDLEAARKYARISQDCFAAAKDIWAEAFPRNLLGHVLYMSGDSEGALAESLFAYERLAPLNGKDSAGGSLVWILFLYREMGDTEGEREVLCKMRELYNDEGVGVLLNEADALEDSPWINPTVLSKRMVSVLRKCEHN